MHHVRRRARDLAWNGQDGQMSASYNRFERMRRRTQRPDTSYQVEVPIEILNRIYEPPARTDETLSAQPSGSSAPQSIVEEPELAHRPSRDSGEAISEPTFRPARPSLRSDSPDIELDQAIQSARYSRGRTNIFRALRFWLPNLILRFRLMSQDLTLWCQISYLLLDDYLNLLLVTVPAGIAMNYTPVSRIAVFFVNFVAIIPTSRILGLAMDELEVYLEGSTVLMGLTNCTFGNAVQLIQSVLLLKNRQLDVLRVSLLGTILTNLLFLTGLSFLIGGIKYHYQEFDKGLTQTITMLLFLAILSLVVPTASHYLSNIDSAGILAQSRGTAVIIIISYALWLLFDLKTHRPVEELYRNTVIRERRKEEDDYIRRSRSQEDARIRRTSRSRSVRIEASPRVSVDAPVEDDDIDPGPRLTIPVAVITILATTALIAINTGFATDSVQSLTERSVSSSFVGLVILPIISLDTGAIKCALHNNMDLAIALSLGRCMQNALMVVPLTILLAWCMGVDDMSLQFDAFTITTLFISMVILGYVVQEGKSNWLTGALLVKIFVIIALASWWQP